MTFTKVPPSDIVDAESMIEERASFADETYWGRPVTGWGDPRPRIAVVGAGPTGIACAIELGKRGVAAACYERAGILDTIYRMPEEMRWFSTRDLLGIAER